MTSLTWLDGLAAMAGRYDAILCDAWGVIHNGRALFPGVAEALMRARAEIGPVIVLTNAPKPAHVIPGQLDRLGLPRDAYDGVVTSGDVTRAEIAARVPGRAHFIGWGSDDVLFEGLAIDFTDLDRADFIICTGLPEDGPAEPEGYRPVLAAAAARGLDFICANPDIVVNWRGALMWCAGALAREYAGLGGRVIYAGKPHPPIYDRALDAIAAIGGEPVPRSRVLAIGDGAATDILGANDAGLDAVFIVGAGGVHEGAPSLEAADESLAAAGAQALGVMERLTWQGRR